MFDIDTSLIFWNVLSFLLLLLALYKLVFPALTKMLEERRTFIDNNLKKAEKLQADAQVLLKQYQDEMVAAEIKTANLLEAAEKQANQKRDETLKAARLDAMRIVENTKNDIAAFEQKTIATFRQQIAEIVSDVSQKIMGKSVKASDNIDLVDDAIKEIQARAKKKA
jgi:F-type H+-transporting ATPase subunit b